MERSAFSRLPLVPPPTAPWSSHLNTSSAVEDPKQRGLWRAVFTALGGHCELHCWTSNARLARRLGEFARGEARRIDRKFRRNQPGSVVHAIHDRKGKRYRVDDETERLLDFGTALWRSSKGAFDLTSGVLRDAWSFNGGPVRADPARIPALLKRIGWDRVGWQPADLILPEDMEIDFAGIDREYAVDRVADWIRTQTNCPVLVNFGGDLRCVGALPESGGWTVTIESSERNGKLTERIELTSGALATSGGELGGQVLDARTGWPAEGTPRSVTVAAATCSQAGSYSLLAMLKGQGAEAFLEAQGLRYWCLR
jgi:thiamine biosynthesis lipoprotein